MSRFFTKPQREIIFFRAGGRCELCHIKIDRRFHADHKNPFSKGGKTILVNAQALCATCNLKKGQTLYD